VLIAVGVATGATGIFAAAAVKSAALGASSSKACGAYLANKPSYRALIATRIRIPGHHQSLTARMNKPINQITTCPVRHSPTSFFFGSFVLIISPSLMNSSLSIHCELIYIKINE
jgi:hypothetical protein